MSFGNRINITRSFRPFNTPRAAQIAGLYDLDTQSDIVRTWDIEYMPQEDWRLGVIVGSSGSGKTTIAREFFGDYSYHSGELEASDKTVLDLFPETASIKDISGILTKVGLGSIPAWVTPTKMLSTGERFRASCALALFEKKPVVLDEFTSVVNRECAKATSYAVGKMVKRGDYPVVIVTCHDDILTWLEPDWVIRTDEQTFEWTRGRLRRPSIELFLTEGHYRDWPYFAKYHYLTANAVSAAHWYKLYWGG